MSASPVDSPPAQGAPPARAEIDRQLERIFASAPFARSARLREFLRYVCDLAARGEQDRINEYLIATEVFGRSSRFDSGDDSTVRRHAHLLRQKLRQYYETEGRDDALGIEIPLGHYVPVFQRRPEPRPKPAPRGARRSAAGMAAAACLVVAAAMFWLGRLTAPASPAELSPPLKQLWGPWIENGQPVLLCLSSPYSAIVKHYAEPREGPAGNPRFEARDEGAALIRRVFGFPEGGRVYVSPNYDQVKLGESLAAVALTRLFTSCGIQVRPVRSSSINWDDLRENNAILFGNIETNAWLGPLLEGYPLRLVPHTGATPRSIVGAGAGETDFATEYPNSLLSG